MKSLPKWLYKEFRNDLYLEYISLMESYISFSFFVNLKLKFPISNLGNKSLFASVKYIFLYFKKYKNFIFVCHIFFVLVSFLALILILNPLNHQHQKIF